MARGCVAMLIAVALVTLGGCGNKEGDEFIGKWQSTKGSETVEISRNDDGFIIANTTAGRVMPGVAAAAYRDGVLEFESAGMTESIPYDKQRDVIVLPTMTGETPFSRVK
jgi:uncharacterized protein (DUF2147 family)